MLVATHDITLRYYVRFVDNRRKNDGIAIERLLIMTAEEFRRRDDRRKGLEEFAIPILRVMKKENRLHAPLRRFRR